MSAQIGYYDTLKSVSGKVLTYLKTLTLDGTDGTTMTFPGTSASIARTDAGQTFTGVQVMTSPQLAGTVNLSGGQIAFPAAQSPSADVNTLDDYEEGTWTPAFTVAGGSVTHSTQTGSYTKVGGLVVCTFYIALSSVSTPSSTLTLTGLPFSSGHNYAAVHFSTYSGFTGIGTAWVNLMGLVSTNTLQFRMTPAAGGDPVVIDGTYLTNSSLAAGTIIFET